MIWLSEEKEREVEENGRGNEGIYSQRLVWRVQYMVEQGALNV